MKKIVALALSLVFVCTLFCSCGVTKGKVVGEYELESYMARTYDTVFEGVIGDEMEGKELTPETVTLELKRDGTFIYHCTAHEGQDATLDGGWKIKKGKIILDTISGRIGYSSLEFVYEDGKILVMMGEPDYALYNEATLVKK